MRIWEDCDECQRLWNEYSDATMAHVRIQGKLELAELQHDLVAIERLRPGVERARQQRIAAREAIRLHGEAVHPDKRAGQS